MKYIRTKNGIYKVLKECEYDLSDNSNPHKILQHRIDYITADFKQILQENVVKQADTIEELCDLIIAWHNNNFMPFMLFELPLINRSTYKTIYGAIWTDKGLIYVAKMNYKGELELL